MESNTLLGVETTKNIYTYPMIGFDIFITYTRDKNTITSFCSITGIVLGEKQLSYVYRNMTFDEFIIYSKNNYLHNLKNQNKFN